MLDEYHEILCFISHVICQYLCTRMLALVDEICFCLFAEGQKEEVNGKEYLLPITRVGSRRKYCLP